MAANILVKVGLASTEEFDCTDDFDDAVLMEAPNSRRSSITIWCVTYDRTVAGIDQAIWSTIWG